MLKNYPYGRDYLKSLWVHSSIELYCCKCFRQMDLNGNDIEDYHLEEEFNGQICPSK